MSFTQRFTERAGHYAAARPSYPVDALDALFAGLGEPARLTAVDLGAGTGISARLLAERGAKVIAVEPNDAMRNEAAPAERVNWHAGSAESTGLPDTSADLVTAFQAFHWFDYAVAVREMARILRPGGRAALVYNERDEAGPFTAAYGDLIRHYAVDETERRRAEARAVFAAQRVLGAVRGVECRNVQTLDRAGVHARARSSSFLPQTGAAADEMHAALEALVDRYAADGSVTTHLVTLVSIAERAPAR
jgi:SAM-dependent methyltransferase